jgi:small subunit ribosomal protein S18
MSADRFDRFSEREERGGDRGDRNDRGGMGGDDDRRGRGGFRRRKVCRFCTEKEATIDYRDAGNLKFFISERGKIVPRRISGNCAKHQRVMATAVKRARAIALIPYAITG